MQKVFKYPLEVTDIQNLSLPEGAIIRTAMEQCGSLCIWAEIDTEMVKQNRNETRTIYVIGTGHPMPDEELRYINSVSMSSGNLIFHIYERVMPDITVTVWE
jgi:hypothetical protein